MESELRVDVGQYFAELRKRVMRAMRETNVTR